MTEDNCSCSPRYNPDCAYMKGGYCGIQEEITGAEMDAKPTQSMDIWQAYAAAQEELREANASLKIYRDTNHVLRETLRVVQASLVWRPIETAPRDGTDFLALCEYKRKHHQMVGCFAPNGKFASWPGRNNYHPTHWMPLPAASVLSQAPVTDRAALPRNGRPGFWTHDDKAAPILGHLYYFAPTARAAPPYKVQRHVKAIIDIADDGTLAGVELIDDMPPPPGGTDGKRTPADLTSDELNTFAKEAFNEAARKATVGGSNG